MTPAETAARLHTELGRDAMALAGVRAEEARLAVDDAGLRYWHEVAWKLRGGPPAESQCADALGARRLWWFMQRIEYCRHRAMEAERRAAGAAADAVAQGMVDIARQWRDLALQAELLARAGEG